MVYIEGILADEKARLLEKKQDYEAKMKLLPRGSIVHKKIGGKSYPYLMFRENMKVKTVYIKNIDFDSISKQIEDRRRMEKALKNIKENLKVIAKVIK